MSQNAARRQSSGGNAANEADRIALVDQLWKLKKHWQEHTGAHVPLHVLIKETDYRRDVLDGAINSGKPQLEDLAKRIRAIEERVGEISSIASERQDNKPARFLFAGVLLALIGVIALTGTLIYRSMNSVQNLLPATNPEITFRLHGSNTVGEELAPALLTAFLQSQGALEVMVAGSDVAVENQVQYLLPEQELVPRAIEVHAHGSSTSFQDLASGVTDMGMSSRPIKPAEIESLRSQYGDLSAPGREHVIALDGLAVIVNPANAVNEMTKAEIAAIFSGEISNWKQLGGPDAPIQVHARDDNSGTYDTFKSLVLKPSEASLRGDAARYESSTELSDRVAADPAAIGFIGLPYVRDAKALAVAESPDTDAIVPTEFTVGTEDYPLSRRLFFHVPANQPNRLMRDFVQFTLSDAGQQVVETVGLISQRIRVEKPRPHPDAPARFTETTRGAQRLSVTLRFDSESGRLDNKGLQDIERIIEFMKQHRQNELLLLGFSDDTGSAMADLALSQARADAVAQMLSARGLYAGAVEGFGSSLPIASNDSDAGRQKNRRVEVWMRQAGSAPPRHDRSDVAELSFRLSKFT